MDGGKETDIVLSTLTCASTHSLLLRMCVHMCVHPRPEYRFRSPSPVLAAKFHDHDPHLILGCVHGMQGFD
jgi:hypothetical protein